MANPYSEQVKALVISNPGQYTYQQVGEQFGLNSEQVRNIARASNLQGYFRKTSSNASGGIISTERTLQPGVTPMREPNETELSRLRAICEARGLPIDLWRVWWDKTKDSSIAFYNQKAVEEESKARDEFLKRIAAKAPKTQKSPLPSKTLAIPANFDVHIGKHCELIRAGHDYTPEKAVQQVLEGQAALSAMMQPFGVTDVLLPLGNDIVHVDNNNSTTTSGTHQDSYGSVESQMLLAAELYIRMIESLAQHYNVWLCHVHSNHDRVSGWSVSQIIAAYFRNHPRVHASVNSMSQQHRKYFVFGNNLIMFHHGEAKEEKLLGIIKAEANQALAQTNRVYVYQGHTHHKTVSKRGLNTEMNIEKDHSSLTVIKAGNGAVNQMHVETVRSPSPSDNWHAQSIYSNMPAVELFLHNEHSQFGRFTHWF